ncbi:MAG: hypothetical protein V1898_01685 [Patescibacteria group bacterium]
MAVYHDRDPREKLPPLIQVEEYLTDPGLISFINEQVDAYIQDLEQINGVTQGLQQEKRLTPQAQEALQQQKKDTLKKIEAVRLMAQTRAVASHFKINNQAAILLIEQINNNRKLRLIAERRPTVPRTLQRELTLERTKRKPKILEILESKSSVAEVREFIEYLHREKDNKEIVLDASQSQFAYEIVNNSRDRGPIVFLRDAGNRRNVVSLTPQFKKVVLEIVAYYK